MLEASSTTRDRLVEAAGEVFADVGYRAARVRQICARAGANIAAVNYHFGGKEGLYRAVLDQAECHAGGAEAKEALARLPAEDQLRVFIREFMSRVFDQGKPAWQGKLMVREMTSPSAALDFAVERAVRPHWDLLVEIVARLAGPAVGRERLDLCAASIMGQCVLYRGGAAIMDRLMPSDHDAATIERRSGHIAEFSLDALAALRRRAESAREVPG